MPRISRQSPTQSKKTLGLTRTSTSRHDSGVLSRIIPVADLTTGMKMLIYGRAKVGKTRLAATFPKPLLILGTEDGTKSIRGIKDIDFFRLQNSYEVEESTGLLKNGKWKTVVLDTAGGLQDLILKEVLGLDSVPVQRKWGMAERGDWMTTGAQWKERVGKLLELSDQYGINVVIIAHERNHTDEGKASDVMLPLIGAAVTASIANFLHASVDYLGNMFIREQEVVETKTLGEGRIQKQIEIHKKTGKKEYCLRVGAHEVFITGFRLSPGTVLPDIIVDPTYDDLHSLVYAEE